MTPGTHRVSAAGEGLPAELRAMGIHDIHPALLEITATAPRVNGKAKHTDWFKPSVTIDEPQTEPSLPVRVKLAQ